MSVIVLFYRALSTVNTIK